MDGEEILRIHSMLHLIFHRNKNQHGKTKWWKWLSILKRVVWNLAVSLNSRPSISSRTESPAEFYKQYLATRVVPRCYLAFSVVVADSQFSTLGTVLIATLARLSRITGVNKELNFREAVETAPENTSTFHIETPKAQEDLGEALAREGENTSDPLPDPQKTITPSLLLVETRKATAKKSRVTEDVVIKPKKKKSKKKNAIDDLFDGLM
ncbi:hypothetical protein ARAM_003138 [Aspergillus rambellii]|uniref:RNase MRP protein 1 RNA binding domain-containing protein n=1 Tax=Aspergillus rambellii TaxID=308745 RepID=A0A0F8VPG3_9EURO|nr:hypothetical protein ARAM_003138 [Aspergillus rambellii]